MGRCIVKTCETKKEEIPMNDLVIFQKMIAAEAGELIGEDRGQVFASGVIAGLKLVKSSAKRWVNDESEPLPEGEHQAADGTNGEDIEDDKPLELDEAKKFHNVENAYTIEIIERVLNTFLPEKQKQVLQLLIDRQPERDRLYEETEREVGATDKLLDIIKEWPTEKVESLGRLLSSEEFTEKLQLQVA